MHSDAGLCLMWRKMRQTVFFVTKSGSTNEPAGLRQVFMNGEILIKKGWNMRFVIPLAALLPLPALGSQLSYNNIFLHYTENRLRAESRQPEKDNSWQASIQHMISDRWFVFARMMYTESDWDVEYRVDSYEQVGLSLEPIYLDVVAQCETRQFNGDLGMGLRWGVGDATDLTLTGLATYVDVNSSVDSDVDYYNSSGYVRSYSRRRTGSYYDFNYKLELGVRSMLTERIEGFGLIARTHNFDHNSYHLGGRYSITSAFDATVRRVQTDDVKAWWAGLVYKY